MRDIKPYLAVGIVALGFGYFYITSLGEINPNDQILIAIVGLMTTAVGYYFGASSSGAKKDDTINNLTQQNKMSYTVAVLDQIKAQQLTNDGKDAFTDNKGGYYTYTDVKPDAPTTSISDAENDEMFFIDSWNGTTPVFSKRKMFPR